MLLISYDTIIILCMALRDINSIIIIGFCIYNGYVCDSEPIACQVDFDLLIFCKVYIYNYSVVV